MEDFTQQARHYGHKDGEWFYGCDGCNPVGAGMGGERVSEPSMSTSSDYRKGYYAAMAKAEAELTAAGYRKQQKVTTVEELDRLSRGATIVEPNGCVWVNDGQSEDPWGSFGEDPFGGPIWADSSGITLPVTVVHHG